MAGDAMSLVKDVEAESHSTRRPRGWSRLSDLPLLPIGAILLLLLMAIAAPWIAPYPPTEQSLLDRLKPPFWSEGGDLSHPLGTDHYGRDVLSRVIWGARVSLSVAFVAIIVAGTIGTIVGIIAGYFGGLIEIILMRIVDAFLAVPAVLVAIVLGATLGPSFENVVAVIGLLYWPRYARQVRGETLAIKDSDYVKLARVAGCSSLRILARHIFPNLVPSLLVLASLQVGAAIILEATLSFLGVGIPPPQPAWGVLVEDGRGMLATAWWISLFPGIAIAITVLAFNLAGDWIRDRLDPKLRSR
jgi:peptide/nickel transport system permease protein